MVERYSYIAGCESVELTAFERELFAARRPVGLILFARNCETPEQVRALCESFREVISDAEALVLIDQEGGRVQRLRPPHWRALPAARRFAELYADDPVTGLEAARQVSRLMAHDLARDGINTNCLPVLDVPVPGAHGIIGDRAYGSGVETIIALGRAVMEGHLAGGVLPVMKHVPGHGRALCDSHVDLPVIDAPLDVLEASDFEPFRALGSGVSACPLAMTAHVVLRAVDADRPATTSPEVMQKIVRASIGVDSLVMTDDLSMHALTGSFEERVTASLDAGCDVVLHCNGVRDELEAVAGASRVMSGDAEVRLQRAHACLPRVEPFDQELCEAWLQFVMTGDRKPDMKRVGDEVTQPGTPA